MYRRRILSLIALSPLALISAKIPDPDPIIGILVKRWKKSKEYTMAVLDAMPEDRLEYRPSEEQLSFAQHFMHLGFTNNAFIGILLDSKSYPDFDALMEAHFFLERPDPINLFQPDHFKKRSSAQNKILVSNYVSDTFDYVISGLDKGSDMILPGEKIKSSRGIWKAIPT